MAATAGVRMAPAPSSSAAAGKKKARKPYTITRPRERWTAEEHERFLQTLHLFGRDWKRIEAFVGTKTSTQIRSHAQKHFLKAQKLGLAACLPPPPLHPRRTALFQQTPMYTNSGGEEADMTPLPNMDWPCPSPELPRWPDLDWQGHVHTPIAASSSGGAWSADASQDETIQLPLSPDDLRFAQVYRFVGDVFGSDVPGPVEANLWRLQGVDPVVVETILLVLSNLEANLSD